MQMDMDKIQFDSRYEIETVATALIEYVTKHPNTGQAKTIQELIELLDVMHMCW